MTIKEAITILRNYRILPKRYDTPQGLSAEYWNSIMRKYGNTMKELQNSEYRWRSITYKDGHKELLYLKVRQNGMLSGLSPGIYRGAIIPHLLGYAWSLRSGHSGSP